MSTSKTDRIITVKTGEDMWAIVVGEDSSFIEDAVKMCIEISREMWRGQKIKITGLDEETINRLKRKVFKH